MQQILLNGLCVTFIMEVDGPTRGLYPALRTLISPSGLIQGSETLL